MEQKNKQSQADDMALEEAEKKPNEGKEVEVCAWIMYAIVAAVLVIAALTLTGVLVL
jgi:hypothetical protein